MLRKETTQTVPSFSMSTEVAPKDGAAEKLDDDQYTSDGGGSHAERSDNR